MRACRGRARPGRGRGAFQDARGMATIGYARVSTSDQNPEARAVRLRAYGCLRVFTDHGVTGRLASRPQWDACRAFLREGDVLVVTKLDRVGRSVGNLVSVAGELDRRGGGPGGAGSGDRYQQPGRADAVPRAGRDPRIRTRPDRRADPRRARRRPRPAWRHAPQTRASISPDKLTAARQLYERWAIPTGRIAPAVGISRASLYRALPPGGRGTARGDCATAAVRPRSGTQICSSQRVAQFTQ